MASISEQPTVNPQRVRFKEVNRGPHVYTAFIEIDGEHWGYVQQRRGGHYQAYTRRNRLVCSAERLMYLRELLAEFYADTVGA